MRTSGRGRSSRAERVGALTGERSAAAWSPKGLGPVMWNCAVEGVAADHALPWTKPEPVERELRRWHVRVGWASSADARASCDGSGDGRLCEGFASTTEYQPLRDARGAGEWRGRRLRGVGAASALDGAGVGAEGVRGALPMVIARPTRIPVNRMLRKSWAGRHPQRSKNALKCRLPIGWLFQAGQKSSVIAIDDVVKWRSFVDNRRREINMRKFEA